MAKKAENVVPLARFRPRDPMEGVPETRMVPRPEEPRREGAVTAKAAVNLTGRPKVWFLIGPGGAGKTTYARWMIGRMVEHEREAVLAALDPGSRTLVSWFEDVEQPPASQMQAARWLDGLLDHLITERVPAVLDFGGGGHTPLETILHEAPDLVARMEDAGLGVVVCYVFTPRITDLDILDQFEARRLQPQATLLVLNEGRIVDLARAPQDVFAPLTSHSIFRRAVARGALPLWMPAIDPEVMEEIELKQLHFAMARDGQVPADATFSPIGGLRRSKVIRWLDLMEQAHEPVQSWLP